MTSSIDGAAPASTVDSSTYQTFLDVRTDGDLIKRVEEQLEDWLRKKKNWDPPTEVNGYHRGPKKRELLILHRPTNGGRDFRARLREPGSAGTWTTTGTVHAAGNGDSWIGLHVITARAGSSTFPGWPLSWSMHSRPGTVTPGCRPRRG